MGYSGTPGARPPEKKYLSGPSQENTVFWSKSVFVTTYGLTRAADTAAGVFFPLKVTFCFPRSDFFYQQSDVFYDLWADADR